MKQQEEKYIKKLITEVLGVHLKADKIASDASNNIVKRVIFQIENMIFKV